MDRRLPSTLTGVRREREPAAGPMGTGGMEGARQGRCMIGQAPHIPTRCRPPPALPAPQRCWQPQGALHVVLCTQEALCFLYPCEILTELQVCGVAVTATYVHARCWRDPAHGHPCGTVVALRSGAPACSPCSFGFLWVADG